MLGGTAALTIRFYDDRLETQDRWKSKREGKEVNEGTEVSFEAWTGRTWHKIGQRWNEEQEHNSLQDFGQASQSAFR